MKDDIMKFETVLPEGFDGLFRFTNWTDEEFVGRWGSKEYRFPAQSTSPMIIPEHSPLEIQHIRKKFAKDLAEREFGKSAAYQALLRQERNSDGSPRLNSIHQAGTYNLDQLAPYIQRCLVPLPAAKATVTAAPKADTEEKLTKNEDGEPNTVALKGKESLRERALKGQGLPKD